MKFLKERLGINREESRGKSLKNINKLMIEFCDILK